MVQEGLENASFWRRQGVGTVLWMGEAGHPRHQFQRSGGQYQDMGNHQGKPCRLRWPRYGSCRKYSAAEQEALVRRTRKTQRLTRRCMTSVERRCRPSAILHLCVPGSRKQELTWRSRLLRETCFTPTCVRHWKELQKFNMNRNI